ncbi:Transposable element Tcb1 transposase-like 4 [Homarus americanus]|uniref:Transposable element Tcb1 transposase-like 4 n=1 Tax=Homarus americanus TaxID=6706 RepID=A0A8J5JEK5_HOMAM|nr:Transposable element Tcb1 transposase-like 4 [Homarus americanus]
MPGTNLTREEKVRILTVIEEKVPVNETVRRTGRNKATIHRLKAVARDLPPASVPPAKPRFGRPRKTTAELQRNLPDVLGNVAQHTIQHRLQKELHLPCRRPAKKPLLTDKMRKARLAFVHKYRHWTPEQWEKVKWSDESTVQYVKMSGNRVRRPVTASRFDHRYTKKAVKHPDHVMVWGCFSGAVGRGGLYFLPRNVTMNSDQYIEVSNEHLLTFYDIHGCLGCLKE